MRTNGLRTRKGSLISTIRPTYSPWPSRIKNENHTYEPNTDLLIAAKLDTNRDGVVSVGDTIDWGTYPTTVDGSSTLRGEFTNSDSLVTHVFPDEGGGSIQVATSSGSVSWSANLRFERFATAGEDTESFLIDILDDDGEGRFP